MRKCKESAMSLDQDRLHRDMLHAECASARFARNVWDGNLPPPLSRFDGDVKSPYAGGSVLSEVPCLHNILFPTPAWLVPLHLCIDFRLCPVKALSGLHYYLKGALVVA